MNDKSLVSIVISCYNSGEYIDECLESIFNQTYKNFEILIVDDGSKDDTLQKINKFKNKKNIFIYSHKNQGLTKSLNFLISKSNGDWIARIDADDVWNKFKLEKQMKLLIENQNISLVYCFHKLVMNNNEKKINFNTKQNLIKRIIRSQKIFCHSSVVFKKSIFIKLGRYREFFKYSQDIDLWLRFSKKTNIMSLKEYLVTCKRNEKQISIINRKEQSIYGYAAKINYLIDDKINIEPIFIDNNFYKWIENKLENISFYDYEKLKKNIRIISNKTFKKNQNFKFLSIPKLIFFEFFTKKNIAINLCNEWIKNYYNNNNE